MTDRLYYHDSFLYNFEAEVQSVLDNPRPALVLDRTAFYPTSGGQIHDTGWISAADPAKGTANPHAGKRRVTEVAEAENGQVVHYLDAPLKDLQPGTRIHGEIDSARRRDHMQQHSAQHVLSAAFVRLFNIPTVSFHMAADYCSIDLDTPLLSKEQIEAAELQANEIILENLPVAVRFVTREEAEGLGLRKIPAAERDRLRIIDVPNFDLSACGGTHVNQTGQIGAILLRKSEKVRQGYRLEFVAGQRAVRTARRDFFVLTEAAASFSAGIYDLPEHIRKLLEDIRCLRKDREQALDELACAQAITLLAATTEQHGRKVIVQVFPERDMSSLKLLAQKLTRQSVSAVAMLAAESPQPALVFAQTQGQPNDMGKLLKETVAALGGRGGGSKDLAQGTFTNAAGVATVLSALAKKLNGEAS